jgi:hypothetical protein
MKIQNLFRSAAVIPCILITTPSPAQQLSGFETPPMRKASQVLPPSLIQGEPMLRVRLREVDALSTLRQTSSAAVGTSAAGKQIGKI